MHVHAHHSKHTWSNDTKLDNGICRVGLHTLSHVHSTHFDVLHNRLETTIAITPISLLLAACSGKNALRNNTIWKAVINSAVDWFRCLRSGQVLCFLYTQNVCAHRKINEYEIKTKACCCTQQSCQEANNLRYNKHIFITRNVRVNWHFMIDAKMQKWRTYAE